jgi:hypothetical protein
MEGTMHRIAVALVLTFWSTSVFAVELLLKVNPSAEYNALKEGDAVWYVSSGGKAPGSVVLKSSPSNFAGGPASYLHVKFGANVRSLDVPEDNRATIQVQKTMRTIQVLGYTRLN